MIGTIRDFDEEIRKATISLDSQLLGLVNDNF